MIIQTENHGPLIVSSTFWGSPYDQGGKLFVSVNAGAIRVLLPTSQREVINELRTAEYAILSRGPWPAQRLPEAVEILWEDRSQSPFAWQLSPESFDMLPAQPDSDRQWVISVWTEKKGRPHKSLERPCHWRRVPALPYLKPWENP